MAKQNLHWPRTARYSRAFIIEGASVSEQIPFAPEGFADNPEPRCPCVLLLDTSHSMRGDPINELNTGIAAYRDELAADSLAVKRVEIAIVTFGPVNVVQEFATADHFVPPSLSTTGDTPMGEAITKAIELVSARKQQYRDNGISFYRPWIFMITDGGPTDAWANAAASVREGEGARKFSFFAVGVENANFDILKQICVREPLRLKGLRFRDLFQWLSNSQKAVSRSQPGEAVPMENPTGPSGWATV